MAIKRLELSNPKFTPANTQVLTIHSSYLGRRHDVSIYNAHAKGNNLPIIVLMHGVYGNHWVWMNLGGIQSVYNKLKAQQSIGDFILVMPSDGGLHDGSAYLPTRNNGDYEQWIMDDVINATIQTVPGASAQSRLYLSGLSMGGYGALRLGIKFAGKVSGISAHSSITQLHEIHSFTDVEPHTYECKNSKEADILHWVKQCLISDENDLPPLRFDCGKHDSLLQGNLDFSAALTKLRVAHQFEIFAGEHSWEYWHANIVHTFIFFEKLEQALTNSKRSVN